MRTMMVGLTTWAKMQTPRNESARVLDTAITVVGTLLAFTTYAILHVHH